MVEQWPPLCLCLLILIHAFHPRPSVFPHRLKSGWKYGEEGHDTGTGRQQKNSQQLQQSVATTLCETLLRLIVNRTIFRAFWAAAAKCATVILLQHSLIKAFVDISRRWQPDWERRKKKTASHWGDAQTASSCQWWTPRPGRPAVTRGNFTPRCEENHFPCLHEYRSSTHQKKNLVVLISLSVHAAKIIYSLLAAAAATTSV